MTPWVTGATGTDDLVLDETTRLDEYSATRIHCSLCGVVVGEPVSTATCPDCAREARVRGIPFAHR